MITLKSFAEEIPVSNLSEVHRFLVLEDEGGRQLRIPVGEEAIRAVAGFMQKTPAPPREPEELEEQGVPHQADEFGGDAGDNSVVPEEPPVDDYVEPQYSSAPNEDAVPSI